MKKTKKIEKKISKHILIPLLTLVIIAVSVLLRFPVYRYVINTGGERYIDSETGVPYLTEMDSYYHLRMTKDILEYGHPGDSLKDGTAWDSYSYAPEGRRADDYRPLMAGIAICVYRVLSIFTSVSIEQVIYWLNMFLSALIVIPVFLFAYELSNIYGAIAAAVISTLNYGYFIHTVPGFYDTDAVITWVSCFFMFFACMMIKKAAAIDRRALILHSAGFVISAVALYHSWYVYYLFVFITAVALFIYAAVSFKKGEAKSIAFPAAASIAFILFVFITEPGILGSITGTLKNIYSKGTDLFPNIYSSISEMKKPVLLAGGLTGLFQMKVLSGSEIGVINAAGGIIPCLASLVSLFFILKRIIKREISPEHILMLIWYAITLVLAFRGWRFIMLFAIPNAILAGAFAGRICALMDKGKMMDRRLYQLMLLLLMTFPTLYGSYRSFGDSLPTADPGTGKALAAIRDNTPDDTILISWWDYGYFFEDKAKRKTLFDGGSQSNVRGYLVAKALATKDELLSSNILRMLSASGDKCCTLMLKTFGENADTLILLDELLSADRATAAEILSSKNVDASSVKELLSLLFPADTPDMKFIITPHMSLVSTWFAQFGMQTGKTTLDPALYAAGFSRIKTESLTEGDNICKTDYGFELVINKSSYGYSAKTRRSEMDTTEPYHVGEVMVLNANSCTEYTPGGSAADSDWCAIVEERGDNAYISFVTVPMAESVFGKLYYCYGAGLSNYEYEPSLSDSTAIYSIKAPHDL